jgi:hypothetical protein
MWVDNCQLFLFQGIINPRKLKGGPSHNLPVTLNQLSILKAVTKSIIPSWFLSDLVECDIRQVPSMGKDIHDPRMHVLLATHEYNFPYFIFSECLFA